MALLWHTDYGHPERVFFLNPKLLGLGRQIGLEFFEAFHKKSIVNFKFDECVCILLLYLLLKHTRFPLI